MDLSWLRAILLGAGCVAIGIIIGRRRHRPIATVVPSLGKLKKQNSQAQALEIEGLAEVFDDFKMVLVVRNDLKMGKGKIAAQCSHATLGLYKKLNKRAPKALNRWEMCGQVKVVLKVESEEDMLVLQDSAKSLKLPTHITIDAGRTQIAPNSRTVMAVLDGGFYEELDISEKEKLYLAISTSSDSFYLKAKLFVEHAACGIRIFMNFKLYYTRMKHLVILFSPQFYGSNISLRTSQTV